MQKPQRPCVLGDVSEGEEEANSHWGTRGHTLMDWGKVRASLLGDGKVPEAFPVILTNTEGPEWVPLDPKGITHLINCAKKRGLKSALSLNAPEALTTPGPLLPYSVTVLMRMVRKLCSALCTLWVLEWMSELQAISEAAEVDPHHPVHGTTLQRLAGKARGLTSPQGQVANLRLGDLIATTDAMIQAFKRLVRDTESLVPWRKFVQVPAESFQSFADRLLQAVEGSDLPKAAQGPAHIGLSEAKVTC